jgi:hypothetical protein
MPLAFSSAGWLALASMSLAACASAPSTGFEPADGAASTRDAAAADGPGLDAPPWGVGDGRPIVEVDCGPPAAACPPTAPEAGSACQTAVDCEYGDDPQPSCNTIASCSGGSHWQVFPPDGPCPTGLAAVCPGSYAGAEALVASGAACDASAPCLYPEGSCDCPTLAGQTAIWRCGHAAPGCPSTRPRYGSACSDGGVFLLCAYGPGCYDLPSHKFSLTVACQCGAWQGDPPCQYP